MYQAIGKLTALAVVVGVGVLVVVQAQRGFNEAEKKDSEEQSQTDPDLAQGDALSSDDSEMLTQQPEPETASERFGDELPTVPASAKTLSSARRNDRPTSLDDEDPFANSKQPRGTTPRRAPPRAGAREQNDDRTRSHVDSSDDEFSLEIPTAQARKVDKEDDDEPFVRNDRRKTDVDSRKSVRSGRGPALPLNALEDEEQASSGASRVVSADDKSSDNEQAPRLLSDGSENDGAVLRLAPPTSDNADPLGDEESTIRRVRTDDAANDDKKPTVTDEPSAKNDEDEFPRSLTGDDRPKALPKSSGETEGAARGPADDEMPIIDRASPRRRPAAPAIPRVDDSADLDSDSLSSSKKPASDQKEPRRLSEDREPAIPLDDEPATPPTRTAPRTSADPFADDGESTPARTADRTSRLADKDEPIGRDRTPVGRPAVPTIEDDEAPLGAPRGRRPATPPADDAEDPAAIGIEPERIRPVPAAPPRDVAPTLEVPSKELRDEKIDNPSPSVVEERTPPRRAPEPQLTIDKIAPPTAVLGKPMVYQILVKNTGKIPARQVVVEDTVPESARMDGSIPQALLDNRRLIWKIGSLEPGAEKKILVRMIPESEGTLGTVATVKCATSDTATNPAAPQLKFDVIAPEQAVLGAPVAIKFRVANVGDIEANSVVIRNVLPAGLRHPDGDDLEYEIGALSPGKTREVELTLTAAQAGRTVNRAIVTADGSVTEEASAAFEIVGPALSIARTGTKRLFPGKTGNYTNTVTNPDSRPIGNVRVVETIPPGMEFASASDGGQYDAAKRQVTWTFSQLGPKESRAVKIALHSAGRGAQISVVRATDSSGATGETVGTTQVAGVPSLTIEVSELAPHVEIGEQVRIPIRILNRGSDAATSARAKITLPAGLQLVSVKGQVDYKVAADDRVAAGELASGDSGRSVIQFSPIKRLDPRADAVLELTLKALQAGNARVRVEVECDQLTEPASREEVVTVAAPQE